MGVYDQAGRYVIKRRPSAFFTWRAPPLWRAWKFLRWQDTRTLPFPGEPDRICDTAAEFEHEKALKGWNMTESPLVNKWQEEARIEKGMEVVRRAIYLRFGTPLPADLEEQLAAIKNKAELDRWFDASQTAPSLDVFRAAVLLRSL